VRSKLEREEFDDDFCCLAAPVRDARGRFLAVIGISMSRRAFDEEHETLATTVRDVDADPKGNGFSFTKYDPAAFSDAVERALRRFKADGDPWRQLRTRAMREDHSWAASAKKYVDMYAAASKARRAA